LTVKPNLVGFQVDGKPKATVVVKNAGTTTAYGMTIRNFMAVGPKMLPENGGLKYDFDGHPTAINLERDDITSGDITKSVALTQDEVSKISGDLGLRLFVWGRIEFSDIFKIAHHVLQRRQHSHQRSRILPELQRNGPIAPEDVMRERAFPPAQFP
jgi:hypothetical protein